MRVLMDWLRFTSKRYREIALSMSQQNSEDWILRAIQMPGMKQSGWGARRPFLWPRVWGTQGPLRSNVYVIINLPNQQERSPFFYPSSFVSWYCRNSLSLTNLFIQECEHKQKDVLHALFLKPEVTIVTEQDFSQLADGVASRKNRNDKFLSRTGT